MNEHEARQAARAARYRQYAENAQRRSDAAFAATHDLADSIPLGQPILRGHHSERHARRDADRITAGMRRGVEERDKAAYWSERAASVENDTSISRHDPDAADKLRQKIAELEALRIGMAATNRAVRQVWRGRAPQPVGALSAEAIGRFAERWKAAGELPHPAYELSNLGSNIRRYKRRLTNVEVSE